MQVTCAYPEQPLQKRIVDLFARSISNPQRIQTGRPSHDAIQYWWKASPDTPFSDLSDLRLLMS